MASIFVRRAHSSYHEEKSTRIDFFSLPFPIILVMLKATLLIRYMVLHLKTKKMPWKRTIYRFVSSGMVLLRVKRTEFPFTTLLGCRFQAAHSQYQNQYMYSTFQTWNFHITTLKSTKVVTLLPYVYVLMLRILLNRAAITSRARLPSRA